MARACSCATGSTPEERLRKSDAVFSGKVVGVRGYFFDWPGGGPSLGPVTFDLEESWKGVSEEPVVVRGYGASASCGLDFQRGERYLVYARRGEKGGDGSLEMNPRGDEAAGGRRGRPAGVGPGGARAARDRGPDTRRRYAARRSNNRRRGGHAPLARGDRRPHPSAWAASEVIRIGRATARLFRTASGAHLSDNAHPFRLSPLQRGS